jgi:multiple sugar transport system substrate-binding protein
MWKWWVIENARHAEELTDMWNPDEYLAKAGRAEGRVVAVPYVVAIKPGFWYNKSLFKEHGLKEPRSWEEFTDLLRALGGIERVKRPIVSGNGTGWPIGDLVEHFIVAFGGPELHEDLMNQRVKWTDPKVKKIFTDYLVPLIEAGAFSDPVEWTQAVELWWGGDYGLYFMGNWITGMISGDPMDLGVFALPGTKGAVTPTDYAFVPKYSENVDLAKRLLAFMISKEGQTIRAESGGKFIIRKDIPVDAYPEVDQAVAKVMSQLDTTLEDLDDDIGGDWQRLFWDQLKLLWVSPESLDDVLSKLQKGLPQSR